MPIPQNNLVENIFSWLAKSFSKMFSKPASKLGKMLGFGDDISGRRGNSMSSSFGSSGTSNSIFGENGLFGNILASLFGTQLTDAQREANLFSHEERIDAQNWTAQREDTELQRRVADAKAAGINPMMVAGSGGVSSPSQGMQSVSPSSPSFGLGDLVSLLMMPAQMKLMNAQAENFSASATEKRAKVPFWEMSTEKALEQINLIRAQIKTEGSKSEFYDARSFLARVNAENIKYLQEAVKNYYEATANASNASAEQSEAAAFMNFIHACYEAKLMDSGYIEQLVKRTAAETADAYASAGEHRAGVTLKNKQGQLVDVQAESGRIANSIADGTFLRDYASDGQNMDWFTKFGYVGQKLLSPLGSVFHVGIN